MAKPTKWLVRASLDFLDAKATPLSDQAKILFMILDGFARTKPYCYPGNERLLKTVDKCERAVQLGLAELEKARWIHRVFFDGKKKGRTGFVLLRRSDPAQPSASTEQEIASAASALIREVKFGPSTQKTAGPSTQKTASELAPPLGERRKPKPLRSAPAGGGPAEQEIKRAIIDAVEGQIRFAVDAGENEPMWYLYDDRSPFKSILNRMRPRWVDDDTFDRWIDEGYNRVCPLHPVAGS